MTLQRLLIISAAFITLILVLALTGLDIMATERLAQMYEPFRYAMSRVTEYGKSEYYLVPALIGALFFWWWAKHALLLCARIRQLHRASVCVYLFACVAVSGLAGNVLKLLIGRSRPKEWLESGFYGIDPFTLVSRWHSFPSGHTNTMVAVVIALSPFVSPGMRRVIVAAAAIIIATRCIVAAHYVSDILGGALVAALVCHWLEAYTRNRFRLPFALSRAA